ncbi:peptidase S8/S53 domain-containing protein [Lactarius sanguifluus]|nr:peptidase S8/S53 domain-containing protein [Lactarius sanguifluus]
MHYHCISVLFVIVLVLLGSLAKSLSPPWDDMHIKHSWNAVPKNWETLGHPPSGTTIDLHIALRPQRENAVIDALHEVTEPGHPRYRAYLTKEQVADLVAPRPETLELVYSWLEHRGIFSSSISMTHGGNTLTLKGVHVERGETIVRTVGYSLPVALHQDVLTVAPTTSFVSPCTQWQTPRNRSDGAVMSTSKEPATMLSSRAKVNRITPSFLRWLYDTEAYTPNTRGENVLGVLGFLGNYPSQADLTAFMQKFRFEAGDATYTVVLVNGGGYDPTHPHQEANVDIQYAEVMAYPVPHIFYSTGQGAPGMEDLFSWLEYILDQENIPQTISISYGIEERLMSREYAINVCDQFAMLGVRGVSVLVSSGNDGIGKGTCLRDDGTVRFMPRFPGTCPYVTVVGGAISSEPEVAAEFSGGGFSDYFQRPTYQEEAVSTFLQDLGNKYQDLYNASGRGFPDIAAQALGLPILLEGKVYGVGGTSVATPIVAGIISLLNDWLISTGQEPLGFLNPWLYRRGSQGLTDITEGSNSGCNMDGFSAVVGWDPVTGLGTPNFRRMLEQLF